MKKAPMNISHFGFILFNLQIFGEIVTAEYKLQLLLLLILLLQFSSNGATVLNS